MSDILGNVKQRTQKLSKKYQDTKRYKCDNNSQQPIPPKKDPFVLYTIKKTVHLIDRKRTSKKKKIEKQEDREAENLFKDIEDSKTKDWFANQYEQLVGKPLHRPELSMEEVLERLKKSTRCRSVCEAKRYKSPVRSKEKVYCLEWSDPPIKLCTCPDSDCTCDEEMLFARKNIPYGERCFLVALYRKIVRCCSKSPPPLPENFIERLANMVGDENDTYQDFEKNGILSVKGADFCFSRCIRYYGPGPTSIFEETEVEPLAEDYEAFSISKCDSCISDAFTCTVSTQMGYGPKEKIVIGDYSHATEPAFGHAIMRDIEGTELRIASCRTARKLGYFLYSVDKILKMHEAINIKDPLYKIKNQITQLPQNIYSSISKIKDSLSRRKLITKFTQWEKKDEKKISSEELTAATPAEGAVTKEKSLNGDWQGETSQTHNENESTHSEHNVSEVNNDNVLPNLQVLDKDRKEQSTADEEFKNNGSKQKSKEQSVENDKRIQHTTISETENLIKAVIKKESLNEDWQGETSETHNESERGVLSPHSEHNVSEVNNGNVLPNLQVLDKDGKEQSTAVEEFKDNGSKQKVIEQSLENDKHITYTKISRTETEKKTVEVFTKENTKERNNIHDNIMRNNEETTKQKQINTLSDKNIDVSKLENGIASSSKEIHANKINYLMGKINELFLTQSKK